MAKARKGTLLDMGAAPIRSIESHGIHEVVAKGENDGMVENG